MNSKEDKRKVAVVTGGARGIGLAAARALADMGFDVAICSRTEAELAKAAESIEQLGVQCVYQAVDVSSEDEVNAFVQGLHKRFKRFDVLVNNAGVQLNKPFLELTSEEWHRVLATNLDSYFYFARAVGKYMVEQRGGKIINISSVLSQQALPGRGPYSVSKAGIEALTRVLASEWAEHNVLVSAIAPGHVDTELVRRDISRGLLNEERMKERGFLSRIGNIDEIGSMVGFLASDKSSYITGQTFVVDGGFSIKK